jgi:hypothetical protein
MNCTGTERQRAVLAAFKVRPEASQGAIAEAAGVTQQYAGLVIRDYLESRAHEHADQVHTRTWSSKPAERDVACFALDRRFGNNAGPAACTIKQAAMNEALEKNPRMAGESKIGYCRRIAALCGTSYTHVHHKLQVLECYRIGAARRAKEAAEAKLRCEVIPAGVALGPVQNFRGWTDTFGKFKILAEAYLNLARSRGDVYAGAFLKEIADMSERAQKRACEG